MDSKLKKAACACLLAYASAMVYFHRRLILAAVKGEPMPDPSEKAKKWCPPVRAAEKAKAGSEASAPVMAASVKDAMRPAETENASAEESKEEAFEAEAEEVPAEAAAVDCKYVVRNTKTGIKFDLKTDKGDVLVTSEVYKSKNSCLNGISSVKKNAPVAALEDQTAEDPEKCKNPKFEVYEDKAGELRFRLKAKNGQIVAVSRSFELKQDCLAVIEQVRENADAEVVEE